MHYDRVERAERRKMRERETGSPIVDHLVTDRVRIGWVPSLPPSATENLKRIRGEADVTRMRYTIELRRTEISCR